MINIQDITPFMKDGWVAMDKDGVWCWYEKKPKIYKRDKMWHNPNWGEWYEIDFYIFKDIASADDWTRSLIKIDNTVREKFEEEYQNNIQRTIQELKQDD